MKTRCGLCKFLKDGECSLGILNKFRGKGVEITSDEKGDPVVGRLCVRLRSPNWDGNLEEEILQKVDVVLQDPTEEMIESINKSTIPPSSVIIVVTGHEMSKELLDTYKKYRKMSMSIDVPVKITIVPTKNDRDIVKAAVQQCVGTFFVRLKDGRLLDETLIEDFNYLILTELEQVVLLRDKKTGENYGMNYGFNVAIQHGPLEEAETIIGEKYWWLR